MSWRMTRQILTSCRMRLISVPWHETVSNECSCRVRHSHIDNALRTGASIPIYRWRQMRQVQFGEGVIKSLNKIQYTKIHIIIAVKWVFFPLGIHQNRCRLGLRPRPHWGSLQRSPDLLAGLGEMEREKEGKGEWGREGKRGSWRDSALVVEGDRRPWLSSSDTLSRSQIKCLC